MDASELYEGSIVWAKLSSWGWWPAVVAPSDVSLWPSKSGKWKVVDVELQQVKFHCKFLGITKKHHWLEVKDLRWFKKEDSGEGRGVDYVWGKETSKEKHASAIRLALQLLAAPRKIFPTVDSKEKEMYKNFEPFYGEPGDVTFVCAGKQFTCHKLLLISQSPVFKAMFTQDTKEKADNTVIIEDCLPEAVQEFLFFLYHARLGALNCSEGKDDVVLGLVHLASKYQVKALMETMKQVLVRMMEYDNIFKLIHMVIKYPELKNISEDFNKFMKDNLEVLVKREGWGDLCAKNPIWVTDFMLFIKGDYEEMLS